MERREFIKRTCAICAMLSSGAMLASLSSCASFPVYNAEINDKKILVPVSLFKKSNIQIIRPADFKYDIALEKKNDNNFEALLLRCTHASNPLNYTGRGFECNLHGSNFNIDGEVTQGPAKDQLAKLKTTISNNNIIIYLS